MFLARVRVSSQYFPVLDCVSYSCARKRSWLSLWLGLAVDMLQLCNVYRTVRKKVFVFLARVRVSSQYFPVLDCVSYSCARKRSWLSLWLGLAVDMLQLCNVYRTVRKKVFVFLARVRVSSQYFPVLDCVSYSCARKRSWLSLWLGLAVDILQLCNVYRTVKVFVFLARIRVSSQYFPVLYCVSYSCARKRSWLSMWLGLAVDILQWWNVYSTVRKKDFVFLARVRVSSQYFPVLDCVSYSCARKRSWLSLWLGLAVDILQLCNVYRTVRKKVFVFLARVRVSSQYFPVLYCVSYSCARKRSLLSLWLGLAVDSLQCWNVYRTVRKKDFVFLARVSVSSPYFPVLDCVSYSCAIKISWLSMWLGLAVYILLFWNVHRTVRKNAFEFLARVMVSSQ